MRQLARRRKLPGLLIALAVLACERPPAAPDPAPDPPSRGPGAPFSGELAHARLTHLLTLPRTLGDPRRAAAIDELAALLRPPGPASSSASSTAARIHGPTHSSR
jgi:hypothetical protein